MTRAKAAELGSLLLVLVSSNLAGCYAALGMEPIQWAGATAAVLGSIVLAVTLRVWPKPR